MEGGPPRFPRDSTCPAVLKLQPTPSTPFAYGALTPSGPGRPPGSARRLGPCRRPGGRPGRAYNPTRTTPPGLTCGWFGLGRVRSPLLAASRLISTPRGTKMFQFPRFPSHPYAFRMGYTGITPCALPHSDIPGSTPADGSPRLFAACHVLHRLLAPRHPPYALRCAASPLPLGRATHRITSRLLALWLLRSPL